MSYCFNGGKEIGRRFPYQQPTFPSLGRWKKEEGRGVESPGFTRANGLLDQYYPQKASPAGPSLLKELNLIHVRDELDELRLDFDLKKMANFLDRGSKFSFLAVQWISKTLTSFMNLIQNLRGEKGSADSLETITLTETLWIQLGLKYSTKTNNKTYNNDYFWFSYLYWNKKKLI